MPEYIPVQGDTYPVRQALKNIGCRWDKLRRQWLVDKEDMDKAQRIVDNPHIYGDDESVNERNSVYTEQEKQS